MKLKKSVLGFILIAIIKDISYNYFSSYLTQVLVGTDNDTCMNFCGFVRSSTLNSFSKTNIIAVCFS